MKKNLLIVLIGGLLVVMCVSMFLQSNVSIQEKICNDINKENFTCDKVFHIDFQTNLVFYQTDTNLMYAIMDDTLRVSGHINIENFKNAGEFFDWTGSEYENEDESILYGLSSEKVKSIIIESEGNTQPNKIYLGDGIWLWYLQIQSKLNLPIVIKAMGESGDVLN